jgi:hypothetical protein
MHPIKATSVSTRLGRVVKAAENCKATEPELRLKISGLESPLRLAAVRATSQVWQGRDGAARLVSPAGPLSHTKTGRPG